MDSEGHCARETLGARKRKVMWQNGIELVQGCLTSQFTRLTFEQIRSLNYFQDLDLDTLHKGKI